MQVLNADCLVYFPIKGEPLFFITKNICFFFSLFLQMLFARQRMLILLYSQFAERLSRSSIKFCLSSFFFCFYGESYISLPFILLMENCINSYSSFFFFFILTGSYHGTQEGINLLGSLRFSRTQDLPVSRSLELQAWTSMHSLRLLNVRSILFPDYHNIL